MTTDPSAIRKGELAGVRVAISVSESADLDRLGLSERHCRLVVAEVSRAVILAGGTVLYGGNLSEGGYTEIMLEEAKRFAELRPAVEVFLPASEHAGLTNEYLAGVERRMGLSARLRLVDESGRVAKIVDRAPQERRVDTPIALTAMRKLVAAEADAYLIVGGRLANYAGSLPGVLEECIAAISARKPVYVAGGYGGAAAAVARQLLPGAFAGWLIEGYPAHGSEQSTTAPMKSLPVGDLSLISPGLSSEEVGQLARAHRPADIASLLIVGLSRSRAIK